jgi:peroxiredoxin
MAGFSPDRVKFVGVNEDEPAGQVKQFLETRGLNLTVALDDGGHVGQQYGADAIPHTVIIGPDGKIAWVKTGYTPGGEGDAAKEVNQLLAAPAPH